MGNRYDFVQVDVFTQRVFAGNPLAIFTDARGLSDQQMQALAREMNLSETTFILPRAPEVEAEKGTRVRIFTVEEELPFAGHPTLGTALYVLSRAAEKKEEIFLDLKVGKVRVGFLQEKRGSGALAGGVFGEMRQRDPEFGAVLSRDEVSAVLGSRGADMIAAEWPCQVVSTGLPFAIVPIRDLKSLAELKPDLTRAGALLEGTGTRFIYFISAEEIESRSEVRARMLFYGGEDPATGSAAGCAISWMVQHGVAQPDQQILIRQGVEAGRPSEISVRASLANGCVSDVRVGGYAVEVLHGTVTFPE